MTNKSVNAEKSSKAYGLIQKSFSNNKNIPLVSPFFGENHFITKFKKFFSLLVNALFMRKASNLPSNTTLYTNNRLF